MIALAIAMLLVGAGFVAPYTVVLAGLAAMRSHSPRAPSLSRLHEGLWHLLGSPWPWTVLAFSARSPGGWALDRYFNQALLNLGVPTFLLCDAGLPLMTVLSAQAHDLLWNRAIMSSDAPSLLH